MKRIKFQGREFISGKTACIDCNKVIKYTWPPEVLIFWTPLCPECDEGLVSIISEKALHTFNELDILFDNMS